jgi:hypothetical protein
MPHAMQSGKRRGGRGSHAPALQFEQFRKAE